MAEFCTDCTSPNHGLSIDLSEIGNSLQPEETEYFLCEGCPNRAIHKDKDGDLFLGKEEQGKLVWVPYLRRLIL